MSTNMTLLTNKQTRKLENIKAGLKRNHIPIKRMQEAVNDILGTPMYGYHVIQKWLIGGNLTRNTDRKLDLLEKAYAKIMHLDISDTQNDVREDAFTDAVVVLDTSKLQATMDDLGLNINQVIFLSRCSDLTEDCLSEPTFSCSEETNHKLEELFYKPEGFFNYVEPEPEPEPNAVSTDLPESVMIQISREIKYDLIACREELERMKKDYSQLRENFFNFTMAFATLEDSNAEIYKMVKELHFALTGSNNNTESGEC